MSLKERLQAVKTRNKADKKTIEDAVAFIDAIIAYSDRQQEAFAKLGYVPARRSSNDN